LVIEGTGLSYNFTMEFLKGIIKILDSVDIIKILDSVDIIKILDSEDIIKILNYKVVVVVQSSRTLVMLDISLEGIIAFFIFIFIFFVKFKLYINESFLN